MFIPSPCSGSVENRSLQICCLTAGQLPTASTGVPANNKQRWHPAGSSSSKVLCLLSLSLLCHPDNVGKCVSTATLPAQCTGQHQPVLTCRIQRAGQLRHECLKNLSLLVCKRPSKAQHMTTACVAGLLHSYYIGVQFVVVVGVTDLLHPWCLPACAHHASDVPHPSNCTELS